MITEPKEVFDVAVVGAGGAGQMALLRSVLNHLKTIIFLGDADTIRKSRAAWVADVENIPGMFDMKHPISVTTRDTLAFIQKRKDLTAFLTVIKKKVAGIKKDQDTFILTDGREVFRARFVILCTGTMDVQPQIGDSIEPILPFANRGDVMYCIRCDGHRTAGEPCAVIGHRDAAGWIAVMLKERYDLPGLFVLTNGAPFEGDDEVKGLLQKYGISVFEEEIRAVLGDANTGLQGFKLASQEVRVSKVFVALGSIVYNGLAKQLDVKLSGREHIITNESGETSVPGFYAAGDLVEGKKKQVYTAWDMAVDAADDVDAKIRMLKREGKYFHTA